MKEKNHDGLKLYIGLYNRERRPRIEFNHDIALHVNGFLYCSLQGGGFGSGWIRMFFEGRIRILFFLDGRIWTHFFLVILSNQNRLHFNWLCLLINFRSLFIYSLFIHNLFFTLPTFNTKNENPFKMAGQKSGRLTSMWFCRI